MRIGKTLKPNTENPEPQHLNTPDRSSAALNQQMRIGWGKAMPKGPIAIYTQTEGAKDEVTIQVSSFTTFD